MNIKWVCLVAGAMALLAILPSLPYSYYQVLRWVLCGSALYLAWGFYESKLSGWALVFLAIGIVFNPIFPVFMNRASWTGIDFITGLVFLLASQVGRSKK